MPTYSRVILLTLTTLLLGCSYVERRFGESCNTRAYVVTDLDGYIRSKYQVHSPVRVAIIPFSTQANLSAYSNELPGLGYTLAVRLQSEFLRRQAFPIIEVFNRQDWPGKKEEFFTGNFNGMEAARDAGYDMAILGFVENSTEMNKLSVYTKVIETDTGMTLWYSRSSVTSDRTAIGNFGSFLYLTETQPERPFSDQLIEKGARCIVDDILKDYD